MPVVQQRESPTATLEGPTVVYEIDPLSDGRWADLVRTHPDASVFHHVNWLSALQRTYHYEPCVLTTSGPGERLTNGLVFCRIQSRLTGRRIVALPFSDHCEPLFRATEDLNAVLEHLTKEVQEKRWDYTELRPIQVRPAALFGFEECSTYCLHTIDLSGNCETLFKSFDKDSVQRRIRRAERESLQYEVGNSEALLKDFYQLFVMTRRRHRLPPQPYSWFSNLCQSFGDRLQIRLLSRDGRGIASTITLKHGRTVTYKYGCSDARFNRFGGIPLLFWKTIVEAKNEGFTRFDLGRSNMDNPGLIKFKENWGGQRVALTYLKAGDRSPVGMGHFAAAMSRSFVKIAPRWSLTVLGKLLYRHIG